MTTTPLQEDLDFLAHYGVKGQKWGTRRTRRIQGHLNRVAKVRDGTASKGERVRVAAAVGIVTSKGASRALKRGALMKSMVDDGEARALDLLLKVQGIRISDLDYSQG